VRIPGGDRRGAGRPILPRSSIAAVNQSGPPEVGTRRADAVPPVAADDQRGRLGKGVGSPVTRHCVGAATVRVARLGARIAAAVR
jgi:hypothetical protein